MCLVCLLVSPGSILNWTLRGSLPSGVLHFNEIRKNKRNFPERSVEELLRYDFWHSVHIFTSQSSPKQAETFLMFNEKL